MVLENLKVCTIQAVYRNSRGPEIWIWAAPAPSPMGDMAVAEGGIGPTAMLFAGTVEPLVRSDRLLNAYNKSGVATGHRMTINKCKHA